MRIITGRHVTNVCGRYHLKTLIVQCLYKIALNNNVQILEAVCPYPNFHPTSFNLN